MFKKQIKRHKKYYGFTLVELIIVITILAILATISFVSFSGYTANSRDSNRLFSLKEISKSLTMQKEMTGNFPQPDEVYAKGGIPNLDNELFSVGLIGKNVSNYVKLGGIPLDPKTGSEYLYGLTRDNKNFQIAGTLENLQSSIIIEKAYANSGLEAVVEGDYKGVIRFTHDNKNYIGNIPSLIFSRNGTYSIEKTFVINKGKNLPYSLDGKNLGTGLTPELVLKELHNKDNLVLTGVVITNTKSETEIKQISDKLGVSDMIVADSLGNKQYASSGGSSGGGTPTTPTITCPEGFILVPGSTDFTYSDGSPTKDFCVAKYEMKNVGGVAKSQASGTPWVNITQPDAIKECNDLGAGYHLITNNEWMTIARNIETNGDNWSGGSVGNGYIYSGHNDSSPNNSLSASTNDTDGYNQTGNSIGNQKRTHTLSNGQVIWDLAGNVWEHVNGANTIDGTNFNTMKGKGCNTTSFALYSWFGNDGVEECNFINGYSKANHGPAGDYNANNGVGRIYSRGADDLSDRIFVRGASWDATSTHAGLFSLDLYYASGDAVRIGFRCAFSVN